MFATHKGYEYKVKINAYYKIFIPNPDEWDAEDEAYSLLERCLNGADDIDSFDIDVTGHTKCGRGYEISFTVEVVVFAVAHDIETAQEEAERCVDRVRLANDIEYQGCESIDYEQPDTEPIVIYHEEWG